MSVRKVDSIDMSSQPVDKVAFFRPVYWKGRCDRHVHQTCRSIAYISTYYEELSIQSTRSLNRRSDLCRKWPN